MPGRSHARERWVPSCPGTAAFFLCRSDAVERREAAGDDADEALAVGGGLPILAERDERHVLPELLLQLLANLLLLVQIGGVEPSGAQFLDLRAVGPAVDLLLSLRPDRQTSPLVGIREADGGQ